VAQSESGCSPETGIYRKLCPAVLEHSLLEPGNVKLVGPTSMEGYYSQYITVAAVAGAAVVMFALMLGLARLLRPTNPTPDKLLTYECGVDPFQGNWSQTHVRYYLYALLFVVFDVEAVFVYPWAVVLRELGLFALVEMAIFIGILAAALVYAYRKGVLSWG
jgi:NADH-quinone oxidoreductase subunit A